MKKETIVKKDLMSPLWPIAMAAALVTCLQPAYATDYSWHTATSGDFFFDGKWTPAGAPTSAADRAIFAVAGEYTVFFNPYAHDPVIVNKRIDVTAGTVKFKLVNELANPDLEATYVLDPPNTIFTTAAVIGSTTGPQARLVVTGNSTFQEGTVDARGALIIGMAPGSSGRVDIGDPEWYGLGRGIWTSAYPTSVGLNGTGVLLVDSGDLTDGGAVLGSGTGSSGTATVEISGEWNNHGNLVIGSSGQGTLNIGGTTVTDQNAYIGRFAGSTGTVNATRSWWTVGGNLYVGGDDQGAGGTGNLDISGLGDVYVHGDMVMWPTANVAIDGGSLNVDYQLDLCPGCEVDLAGGKLKVGSFTDYDEDFLNWTGGEVQITSGNLNIDVGEPFGINLQVGAGKTLTVANALRVGPYSNGIMGIVSGGTVTSDSAVIGSLAGDALQASAILNGEGTSWTIAGDLSIRSAVVSHLSVVSGPTVSNGNAYLAAEPGTNALVTLWGATSDVLWNCDGDLYVGGDEMASRGEATVEVRTAAVVNVTRNMKVWDDSVVEIDGGTVITSDIDIAGEVVLLNSGTLDVQGGMIDVENGGTLNGAVTGDSWTEVTLREAYTSWLMPGSLEIGAPNPGAGHVGALSLEPGTDVAVDENVTVFDGNRLALSGGTINAAVIDFLDNDFSDFGTINGEFSTTGSVTATGELTVGDISSYSGVQIGGALNAYHHHVTIKTNGAFTVGDSTSIAGGTLDVPNGIILPAGNSLVGHGTIAANVATQIGSTIEADGGLSLGDSASPVGFVMDGNLVVNAHTVTIEDANEAALGPMTSLGNGGSPGTLIAFNGLLLANGDNIFGFGTIDTPDDPAKPLINDGSIVGDSADAQIELTGYVKGFGTLDNVTISGTDDPGVAGPSVFNRGSVDYAGRLIVRIGGVSAGSGYDQINHSGTVNLGGELVVELINGFEPDEGDSFTILTYGSHSGEFTTLTLPTLAAGLAWDVDYGATGLSLVVEAQIPGNCDGDGDVDLVDYAGFENCLTGPGTAQVGCDCFDVNSSGTVDLADFAVFQNEFIGTD